MKAYTDIEQSKKLIKILPIETTPTEELVDACVEMIMKLHEQKLL